MAPPSRHLILQRRLVLQRRLTPCAVGLLTHRAGGALRRPEGARTRRVRRPAAQSRVVVSGAAKRLARYTVVLALLLATTAQAAEVYVRFKVVEPQGEKFRVTTGGFRHDGKNDQWHLPNEKVEVEGGAWSRWVDLTRADLHGRLNRQGGVAEWPAMKLDVAAVEVKDKPSPKNPLAGCTLEVQLADKPDPAGVVITFTEKSASNAVGFLLPHPLREKKAEFETGSQMAARHRAWAKEATGGRPAALANFGVCTSIWGHYDPALARQETETLKMLGFNVVGGVPAAIMRACGVKTYGNTGLYDPDPEKVAAEWRKHAEGHLARTLATEDGKWEYANMHHFVISDEISVLNFKGADPARLNGWFRDYLRQRGVAEADLGKPIDQAEYPTEAMTRKTLARFAVESSSARPPGPPPWTQRPLPALADLKDRRLLYHAAKFGQWWSARQLRQTSDLVRASLAGMKIEALPTDHGFLGAWGPPNLGMSYRLLDLFELGAQESIDILDGEDWLGLNHMYGPGATWTGAQTFEYFNAILRSSITGRRMTLMSLITPSDDGYLRLKAYSALGQGAKTFFFWTYGPTCIGTENYWSDLRSEYDGLAKFTRALAAAEDVVYEAATVRDPVAILYSVSHDIWHNDDPASFVENRLTWHALRHLGVQPDLLREEDVEAGRLGGYKVLHVTGQCLARRASAAIDQWVKEGGVAYLSAGAATRDEFYEPYVPPFAAGLWPADAAGKFVKENHAYNERGDLPTIKPMTHVTLSTALGGGRVPVIGGQLDLRKEIAEADRLATFADGAAAGANLAYGKGRVIGVGFFPMLAYSPFKQGQTTLDEKWPENPRQVIRLALEAGQVAPVARPDVPVVEASLLTGPRGSALVLVNYTYQPIPRLKVNLRMAHPVGKVVSTEGAKVSLLKTEGGAVLELPLEWTDIILLPKP